MSYVYVLYLGITLVGTLLLADVFKVSFSHKEKKAVLKALMVTAVLFTLWDILAVQHGYWAFQDAHILGIFFYNQPIEEIGFFFVIPFFGWVVWRIFEKWEKKS